MNEDIEELIIDLMFNLDDEDDAAIKIQSDLIDFGYQIDIKEIDIVLNRLENKLEAASQLVSNPIITQQFNYYFGV